MGSDSRKAGKRHQAESLLQHLQNNPIGCEAAVLQTFLQIISRNFRYQPIVSVSGNLAGKVPVVDDVLSCQVQKVYSTNSTDENWIKIYIQMACNSFWDRLNWL